MQNKRAAQFQPFDALSGLKRELKERERIIVPKKDLSEDELELLNYKMSKVKIGMIVTIEHFDKTEYIKTVGVVSKIEVTANYISVVKTKIFFKNIIGICSDSINLND